MAQGSSGKLADTTFNTAPDDELAVVDVYENESSDVENSFQDEYHKAGGAADSFEDIGKGLQDAAKGGGSIFDSLTKQAGGLNDILQGLKSGNLNSLTSLVGGSFGGLKQLSDMANQASSLVSGIKNGSNSITSLVGNGIGKVNSAIQAAKSIGNTLKGGLNASTILNSLSNNNSLVKQIQSAIRQVGAVQSNFSSLEHSLGRASSLLGGDRSSANTVSNGFANKASTVEKTKPYDTPVSKEQTKLLVDKLKAINPQVGSAISELPTATQEALVRGFTLEGTSKGLKVGTDKQTNALNSKWCACHPRHQRDRDDDLRGN